ncbi:P-loop containing nucleoside triphosphate hydrolase protein [Pseudovirgaria hyperparasitica]|uniref:P-loop containing nucleoside triphosphate hydrolase protein n=1 Tax=Pseudovirgaria hyperparasitica TaxID=470096 RepID=A0A6A6VZL9_9PEZI|nr:P-loop containing nucleoside triphosphate hydrolase protein [Pseudovirgaria hyperparasitica]KAF2755194.1 P-loop containing nucleoside triphosphate hydrolase protein [Pseudovirgaria hyperparasitica]
MTGASNLEIRAGGDEVSREYLQHSSAQRINTDIVIVEALRKEYPELRLTVTPASNVDLFVYASAGHASVTPVDDSESWTWRVYAPPARRLDGGSGTLVVDVKFGKFLYKWQSHEFIVYLIHGRDGGASYPDIANFYILSASNQAADDLIKAAGTYASQLHDQVWVFDQGFWQKSKELYNSFQKASWDDVILDSNMKKELLADVENFFDSRETYDKLRVPWKRGTIYYGPPGNGKTISIKAMMRTLFNRKERVSTLYVRTLSSFAGPEYSLSQIFTKARQEAPCYLVFEDLDSIVDDRVRSYFLNEVDGLKKNDGIMMIGSTNHLDRLDPGISKRPSRFDRKFYFADPNFDQRVKYCEFWQHKLADNEDIDYPDKLCVAIAKITDDFSFAYIQEAFVAALLSIAAAQKNHASRKGNDLDDLVLWKEIQKQVKILREEMEEKHTIGSHVRLVHRHLGDS